MFYFQQSQVRRISQLVLKKEHAYINTLGLESTETNSKVYFCCCWLFLFIPYHALLYDCRKLLEDKIHDLRLLKQVKQFYLVANHDQHMHIVHHLLKRHISEVPDYKVALLLLML